MQHEDEQGEEELRAILTDIAGTRMPFGKFGPEKFPPEGVPIYDLPYEYLAYFARKGFPKGPLGERMQVVYQLKRDGADAVFDPLRQKAGGRHSLRKPRKRRWTFDP